MFGEIATEGVSTNASLLIGGWSRAWVPEGRARVILGSYGGLIRIPIKIDLSEGNSVY